MAATKTEFVVCVKAASNGLPTEFSFRARQAGSDDHMEPNLIYDVGMHNGDDTAYYLHKGYRVVGVEVNPVLATTCRLRFPKACETGQLQVLNVGIGPSRGTFTFWINKHNDTWSSFIKEVASREGTESYPVPVPCVPFSDVLSKYEVPFYLKIDIEGADELCLSELWRHDLPAYVSFEATSIEGLCLLCSVGYNAFKCIDQTTHNRSEKNYSNENALQRWRQELLLMKWALTRKLRLDVSPLGYLWRTMRRSLVGKPAASEQRKENNGGVFAPGPSGSFGEETLGPWLNISEVSYNWLHLQFGYSKRGTLRRERWYDFHATHKEVAPVNSPTLPRVSAPLPRWASLRSGRREFRNEAEMADFTKSPHGASAH